MPSAVTRYFLACGNVQGVMFRQTFIRGAIRRNLIAGATNLKDEKNSVSMTLHGEGSSIENYINILAGTKPLNSWGAQEVNRIKHNRISTIIRKTPI